MKTALFLVSIICLFAIQSCKYTSVLPEEVPQGLIILYTLKVDDSKESKYLKVTNDSVVYEKSDVTGKKSSLSSKIERDILEYLYKELLTNNFDLLKNVKPKETKDSGFVESMSIVFPNFSHSVSNGTNYPLESGIQAQKFQRIKKRLLMLVSEQ